MPCIRRHPADQDDEMPAWARRMEERLEERFIRIENILIKTYNLQSSAGRFRVPYEVVPTADGVDPTQRAHNPLPPLRTVHDMRNLTAAQLNNYLDTYGIPYGRRTTREAKISSLRTYIGCIAEV
ncbi:hypothetical protein ARMGADRAFT_1012702 [Armillaria gallica]|uniref:Mug135-like C-terminal domain-containing protein n=1 Tax=Armillaria gallica TaxID=47427 RepID=A0A2H3DNE8_ARMGA|nr:hypothetical protein ARMGADRAFT_1012702 [Armillaria gallica]